MLKVFCWFLCIGLHACTSIPSSDKLEVVYQWNYFDYVWPSERERQAAVDSGEYNYTKLVSIDVDKWKDKIFVTIIKDEGVPATLNTVSDKVGKAGHLLQPYPDWSWHRNNVHCDGITNVYRVAIDKCDRLWVLDTGIINDKIICPPKVLVFDLTNNSLIKKVRIPDDVAYNATGTGLLVNIIVQTSGCNCENTYVLITDVVGFGLIVYDGSDIWRLNSRYFEADPTKTLFVINGESFELQDGILGLALTPEQEKHTAGKTLYFRSLASTDINSVNSRDLLISKYGYRPKYRGVKNILQGHVAPMAFSKKGILFLGVAEETSVVCWNFKTHLNAANMETVSQNSEILQFASGLKIITNDENEEDLWLSTNRMQKVFAGTMKFDETNFRILRGNVHSLTAGTICDTSC